ncbi:hypothetical protein ACF1A5_04105 [Streptomyces sp. NPDC014864]|uniref:hypothetical protein n=1 Tax=Streptomyces sp. NPDC014864 TaxID=3364924 RepID=UPI0036FEBD4A
MTTRSSPPQANPSVIAFTDEIHPALSPSGSVGCGEAGAEAADGDPVLGLVRAAVGDRPVEEVVRLVTLLEESPEYADAAVHVLRAAAVDRPVEDVARLVAELTRPPRSADSADDAIHAAVAGRGVEDVSRLMALLHRAPLRPHCGREAVRAAATGRPVEELVALIGRLTRDRHERTRHAEAPAVPDPGMAATPEAPPSCAPGMPSPLVPWSPDPHAPVMPGPGTLRTWTPAPGSAATAETSALCAPETPSPPVPWSPDPHAPVMPGPGALRTWTSYADVPAMPQTPPPVPESPELDVRMMPVTGAMRTCTPSYVAVPAMPESPPPVPERPDPGGRVTPGSGALRVPAEDACSVGGVGGAEEGRPGGRVGRLVFWPSWLAAAALVVCGAAYFPLHREGAPLLVYGVTLAASGLCGCLAVLLALRAGVTALVAGAVVPAVLAGAGYFEGRFASAELSRALAITVAPPWSAGLTAVCACLASLAALSLLLMVQLAERHPTPRPTD